MKTKKVIFPLVIGLILTACGSKGASSINPSSPSQETPSSVNSSVSSQVSESKDNSSVVSSASSVSSSETSSNNSKASSTTSVAQKVKVTVTNGTGSGEYDIGSRVTVDCTVPEKHEFEAWKEGDVVISKSKTYSFLANRDITLTATFIKVSSDFKDVAALNVYLSSINENIASKTVSSTYEEKDDKVTNQYRTTEYTSSVSYYKDAKVANVEQTDTSSLSAGKIKSIEVFANKEAIHYDVCKYETKSVTYPSHARKFDIVDGKRDENKFINTNDANKKVTNTIVTDIANLLLSKFNATNDSFTQSNNGDKKTVQLVSHSIQDNFYIQNKLSFVLDEANEVIDSVETSELHYVRSTSLAFDGTLLPTATPSKDLTKKYAFTYGTKENMPSTIDLNSYFISSFDVYANYYDRNAARSFNKDFLYLPVDGLVSIYDIDIDEESVMPKTACEELKIANIISSNKSVVDFQDNHIITYVAGKASLTFVTTQGAKCTYNVEVKPLAPNKITISSADVVEVGEQIELAATVAPITASTELDWSVNNANGKIVKDASGKVYLEGLAAGSVTVTATSKEDSTKFATKTIVVTEGTQSLEGIKTLLVGTWFKPNSYSAGNQFELIFNADGSFQVIDNYRAEAAKFQGNGHYEVLSDGDETMTHTGTFAKTQADCFAIRVTDFALSGSNNGSYFVDFHFAIKNDGSKLYFHAKGNADQTKLPDSSTVEFEFTKQ